MHVQYLRPPLELLPLVPRKLHPDQFKGLVLVADYPRQNWQLQLTAMAFRLWIIPADQQSYTKRWAVSLMAFSNESLQIARS